MGLFYFCKREMLLSQRCREEQEEHNNCGKEAIYGIFITYVQEIVQRAGQIVHTPAQNCICLDPELSIPLPKMYLPEDSLSYQR